MTKKCYKCKEVKPLSEFYCNRSKKDGHQERCKRCQRDYFKQPKAKKQRRVRHHTDRQLVLNLLGHCCALCGCEEERWLTIDHVTGGGKEHRKERSTAGTYRDIIKDPDAKKKYRVLCYQCNDVLPLCDSEMQLLEAIEREHNRIIANFVATVQEANKE